VVFGSIIARIGLPGEAHYAVANEWMARDLAHWSAQHPECRTLALEWSVWSGTGMGDRLAHLEGLHRAGVSPISIEEGVRAFREALASHAEGAVVIAGRFGSPPTIQFASPELPLLRFLERARVHYPGIELVSEADLSAASDPYLEDHVFEGARLLPGVMALEAMAQAAMAAAGAPNPPAFEQVRFARPVIVPADGALTVRLVALVREKGAVEVALRSAETSFQTDHFRAVCRFGSTPRSASLDLAPDEEAVPLDPARELYGGLLFQQGRFRRLCSYLRLRATECIAEAAAGEPRPWFNRHLPQQLLLGDPALRDAAIHAIQACIPHARVLPGGAAEIWARPQVGETAYRISARERSREGSLLTYDLEITNSGGELVESWRGLELRIVGTADLPHRWPAALLAPYLERRLAEAGLRPGIAVALSTNGHAGDVPRRADGKPLRNGGYVARSHADGLTLEVSAAVAVGCDCEPVTPRPPEVWRDLLGADGFALANLVSRSAREPQQDAATRVWCALECLKKAGARPDAAIVLPSPEDSSVGGQGWIALRSGAMRIDTLVAPVSGIDRPLAIAILVAS
jgi:enediyne polyketide synthase